jgi:signal transduction histidine kinase/CheY-like chemotaxis protein
MPLSKSLIICASCFLIFFSLGLLWTIAEPMELTRMQRAGTGFLAGFVVSIGLFVYLRQERVIAETRQVAQRSHLARGKFAASLGHEIRTPLSGILGVMHLLKRTQLDRNQQRYVDTASNSANMLLMTINEALAQGRMDTGGYLIESESLELTEVIEDVTSILAPEAFSRGLELVCDIDPKIPHRIKGDALRLRQILNNLLINAIQYTETGVIAVYAVGGKDSLEIGVRDTGIGIDPERQKRLLQSLGQTNGASDPEGNGLGLGLTSSRRLLRAMGSALQLESKLGHGSRFFFELPVDADLGSSFDWKPPRALQDLSIAILSPLELQRKSICNMLAHWNISAIQQFDFDADKDRDLPELKPCDLLIIDQSESEQAVDELIERLRNSSSWRNARFVHLVPQNRESEGGNADVRLYKPLSHSRLYATLLDIVYRLSFNSEYDTGQALTRDVAAGILAGHRILLVEDNDISKMIVLEMLEETGVDVDVAINGTEAIEQVKRHHYDLILMDIQMPVLNGYEATRAIRALQGEYESIPIIAMTAHALEGDSGKSLDSGMNFHISKPFEPESLIETIARFVKQGSQPG